MDPKEQIGLNPTKKPLPVARKRKVDPDSILFKHRRYLQSLQEKQQENRVLLAQADNEKKEKLNKFREQAAN